MSRREKRKSGNAGSFFFGSFIGFLLCLAALAGLGCFVYFKVSPAWLNKHFNTNIDLGNDEINNKTLKNFVGSAINLAQNVDTYTLNNLKNDFGIEISDEIFGLDVSDLKNTGLKDLPNAIETKFGSISADELRNINGMNLDDMSKILDKTNTYYYNSANNKLYEKFDGTNYTVEVDFDYEVNSEKTKIITKKHETSITLNEEHGVLNQVNIQLWYLPLTKALSGFTSNMGSQITLAELETDYGVKLPEFLDNIDKANTTINELEEAINGLYIADFLGYTVDETDPQNLIVKDKNQQEVTGVMYELAIETVEGLKDIESKFSTLSAVDLEGTMDLSSLNKIFNKTNTYYVNGNKLYKESSHTTEVDFDYEIIGTNVVVEGENFAIVSGEVDIVLKYLPISIAISDFTSDLGNNLTLQELEEDYGVVLPEYIIKGNGSKTINEIETIIDDLYIADILGYTIEGEGDSARVMNGTDEVKGIMAIVAKEKVGGLADIKETINKTKVSDVLDLNIKKDSSTGSYYDDQDNDNIMDEGEEVTVVMNIIANTTVEELTSTINDLTLGDIFTEEDLATGALALIPSTTLLTDIATELNKKFRVLTLGELIDNNVIELDSDSLVNYNNKKDLYVAGTSTQVKNLLLEDLINLALDNIPTTSTPLV